METVIEKVLVRTMILELKQAGAQGIIEYPLSKMVM